MATAVSVKSSSGFASSRRYRLSVHYRFHAHRYPKDYREVIEGHHQARAFEAQDETFLREEPGVVGVFTRCHAKPDKDDTLEEMNSANINLYLRITIASTSLSSLAHATSHEAWQGHPGEGMRQGLYSYGPLIEQLRTVFESSELPTFTNRK